jgi:hypothetical protein
LKYESDAQGGLLGNSARPNPLSFLPLAEEQKGQETNGETITALLVFDKPEWALL